MTTYDHIFDTYTFVPQKALSYGFTSVRNGWLLRKALSEKDFYTEILVSGSSIVTNVYEEPDGEPYLPYHVTTDVGAFVSSIRAEVDGIVDEMVEHCFVLTDVKSLILEYVSQKYGTVPEKPWREYEEYCTFNIAKKHKWYGLLMQIPYHTLGIEAKGKINVLNVKAAPERITALIDNKRYFPAYHMNKKHWITVLLDKQADMELIKNLLDESYRMVEKQ